MPSIKIEKTEKEPKYRKLFTKPRFLEAPIEIGKDDVTIKLPIGILAHMELTGKIVHFTVINGVLQVSGHQPQVVIPVLTSGIGFESQESQD